MPGRQGLETSLRVFIPDQGQTKQYPDACHIASGHRPGLG
jgi:hypothetical protein